MYGRLKNWLEGGGWILLLEIALVGAIAAALAHWTWVALTPRSLAAPASANGDARRSAPALKPHLFGASSAASPIATTRIRLIGVVSPDAPQRGGRAIFALEGGKPRSAAVGENVGGFVLHEVHADHVLLSHDGAIERLPLERRARR